ncbi:bleomycin resistance protein [Trinickia symbiotica]|uniref:Bleomycin resistance protein n=1 Tax=Trinickia symbiotica TaxID=863227 RepID=A0A2T3XTJ5_9BURK|nr:VOC family protein [Trinickia symbiotica]PTB19838.1 bleomycin resistance protein [Trinickia symbiotica]
MSISLNHTIVYAHDRDASAAFLTDILGLPKPTPFGPFLTVHLSNDVTMDFMGTDERLTPQHYAFLVGETEFGEIMERIEARKVRYWADPAQRREGEISARDGGRGAYFEDPNGHLLEIITRPYGGH